MQFSLVPGPKKGEEATPRVGFVQGLKKREESEVYKEVKFAIGCQIPSGVKITFMCLGVQHGK